MFKKSVMEINNLSKGELRKANGNFKVFLTKLVAEIKINKNENSIYNISKSYTEKNSVFGAKLPLKVIKSD